MKQPRALLSAVLPVVLLGALNAQAAPPPIAPGAEEWVIAADVPPFSVTWARGASGGGALGERWFGSHPENGGGLGRYEDPARHMLLEARVWRETRTTYLDHLMEGRFRKSQTGRFTPRLSLVTLFGNAVLFYCSPSPDCNERTYVWRSGTDLVVTVSTHAYDRSVTPGAGPRQKVPCPEPTEILQAYLTRYPSSLTQNWQIPVWSWIQDEQRGREHLRTEVALELAAAKYWLAMALRVPVEQVREGDLRKIEHHLKEFARLRQAHLSGRDAEQDRARIKAVKQLAPAARFNKLQEITQEYQTWWDGNQGTPIVVPPLPPVTPTPANTPTPASSPTAPPP